MVHRGQLVVQITLVKFNIRNKFQSAFYNSSVFLSVTDWIFNQFLIEGLKPLSKAVESALAINRYRYG